MAQLPGCAMAFSSCYATWLDLAFFNRNGWPSSLMPLTQTTVAPLSSKQNGKSIPDCIWVDRLFSWKIHADAWTPCLRLTPYESDKLRWKVMSHNVPELGLVALLLRNVSRHGYPNLQKRAIIFLSPHAPWGLARVIRCRNWISCQLKPIGEKSTAWGLLNDQFSSKELPRQRITDLSGAALGARRIKPVHDRNDSPKCQLRKHLFHWGGIA